MYTKKGHAGGAERQGKEDPVAFAQWQKYKKSRDYQIKCQIWGRLGGC